MNYIETKPPQFLASLRAANLSRLPRFGHGDLLEAGAWLPMQWGAALAGEVGELSEAVAILELSKVTGALCNTLKKHDRQMLHDPPRHILVEQAGKEIADVLCYLDLLAARLGLDLQRVTAAKFNEVSEKTRCPERLDAYTSEFYLDQDEGD